MGLLDFKSQMDRRLNELAQELPSKLNRELRSQETREH